jgi:hypothetical protein
MSEYTFQVKISSFILILCGRLSDHLKSKHFGQILVKLNDRIS